MAKGCSHCIAWEDDKGGKHHQRDCPEMFFANGRPRGVTPPEEMARYGKLGSGMTLQDELTKIFSTVITVSEEVPDVEAEA